MPQQTEPRVAGRHRHERVARHRAGLSIPIGGPRARGTVLTAALGAALVTGVGVAGGSAAAASHHTRPSAARVDAGPSAVLVPPSDAPAADDAGPSAALIPPSDPPAAYVPPTLSAVAVKRKQRPVPSGATPGRKRAAWVNPNPTASVTSCFGPRWGRMHEGVDLAAADGTPIVAAGAGVVVRAGEAEGYGNAVLIDHGNGYLTHYGHLSAIVVTVGQHVTPGQQIGNEGSTGHSTGPHLHFEVHRGYYQNPIEPTQWMHEHGVDIPGCVSFTG